MNLENKIERQAVEILPVAWDTIDEYEKSGNLMKGSLLKIPFLCYGVVNTLVYLMGTGRIIGIEYPVAIETAYRIENCENVYCDNIEMRTLNIDWRRDADNNKL